MQKLVLLDRIEDRQIVVGAAGAEVVIDSMSISLAVAIVASATSP